jgi:hypothetical protein
MNSKVYIETSVISYFVARPSRDIVIAANQQATQEWWYSRKKDFEIYVSQLVIQEAGAGDEEAAASRLEALENFPLLDILDEAIRLVKSLLSKKPSLKRHRKMPSTLLLQRFME